MSAENRGEKVIDLDAIRALEAAATPGPWEHGYDDESGRADGQDGGTIVGLYAEPVGDETGETVVNGGRDDWGVRVGVKRAEDAEFIAAARTAVPDLLVLLDEARSENDRLVLTLKNLLVLIDTDPVWRASAFAKDARDALARFPAPSPTGEETTDG